jgi:L-malate glycosyltransferase
MLQELGVDNLVEPFDLWMGTIRNAYRWPLRILRNRTASDRLTKRIEAWKPDLIHSNSSVIGIGYFVAAQLKVPHVWHLRELPAPSFGLRFDLGRRRSLAKMASSDWLIAISQAVRCHFEPATLQAPCSVIHNGVFTLDQMLALHEQRRTSTDVLGSQFAMIGRIGPNKGQRDAIEAMSSVVQRQLHARLLLVGSGGHRYLRRLKRVVSRLRLEEHVSFAGYVSDPVQAFMKSGIVLSCSKFEGMGRSTAEAMSIGVPVIGRNGPGTAELIDDGTSGLLYDGTVEDLSEKMLRLMSDDGLRRNLAEAAHHYARENFTIEKYASSVWDVYQRVLSN